MAAELRKLGQEFGRNGHPIMGGALRFGALIAKVLRVPEHFPENGRKTEKTTLEAEWQRQANRFVELGFHKELIVDGRRVELTVQEYLKSLPRFESQPKEFRGRLNTPLLVETRIPIEKQMKLARIRYFLEALNKGDWSEDPQGYETPKLPYTTWTDEGARFMGRKVEDVRRELVPDERGGTEFDAVALYIAKPDVLKTRSLDLPGTAVGSDDAAYLALWYGQPELDYDFVGNASPAFGSLVCGRKNKI